MAAHCGAASVASQQSVEAWFPFRAAPAFELKSILSGPYSQHADRNNNGERGVHNVEVL